MALVIIDRAIYVINLSEPIIADSLLNHEYLDLKHSFERLKGDYSRLQQRYASLDASFDRVQEENRGLKAVAKDYDTLCRGYGEKEVAARVRAIQEREAAERQQRRTFRPNRHEIDGR